MADINDPIIKESVMVYGCKTGQHEIDRATVELEVVGSLTRMKMRCLNCGGIITRDADLNINDILTEVKAPPKPKEPMPDNTPEWGKAVRGRYEKESIDDSFWENIKKGR